MMKRKLHNYARSHRRLSRLSQQEVAYLIGFRSGSNVGRFEMRQREFSLETAFAYEVIFGVPVRDMFAGLYDDVENRVMRRVELLARRLMKEPQAKNCVAKLDSLAKSVRYSTRPESNA